MIENDFNMSIRIVLMQYILLVCVWEKVVDRSQYILEDLYIQQDVALTERNMSSPPCSVGHPTAHAPGRRRADCPRVLWPAGPPAGSVTDDRRRQTSGRKTILAHYAVQ